MFMICISRCEIIGLLALALSGGCASTENGANSQTSAVAPNIFLKSVDSKTVSLAEFKGKVVVLDFWATWCVPCRQRLQHLQALGENLDLAQRGLVVLTIDEREERSEIQSFLRQFRYTFIVLCDDRGEAARDYSISGLPSTIVVGRDGKIASLITADAGDADVRLDAAISRVVQ